MGSSAQRKIESLKEQSRLNVQEQIQLKRDSILKEAKYWREHGIPEPLERVVRERGVDLDKSIVLNYEQDYPGISTDEGMIITPEATFYEFEADLNPERTELIELYSFTDVSSQYEITEHLRGTGKSYGFLVMEVLKELNSKLG